MHISGILLGTKIGGRNLQFQDPGHAKPWEEVGKLDFSVLAVFAEVCVQKYLEENTFLKFS